MTHFFSTAKSLQLVPLLLSFYLLFVDEKCMHAYAVWRRQGCRYNRFVSSVCVFQSSVSLTACHFRQIFQSVTFLKKWNHRTLRIKWFHMIFHRLAFLHLHHLAASSSASVSNTYWSNGRGHVNFIFGKLSAADVLELSCSQYHPIAWRSLGKTVNPVTASVSQPCSASQTWLLCFYILAFILLLKESQHLFNKIKKGCKQNALCCSSHDWMEMQLYHKVFRRSPNPISTLTAELERRPIPTPT